EVITNGDSPVPEPPVVSIVVPPKTEAQKLSRKNKLKAKTIKIRFGGNKESKKMHKTILKQQYENFVASRPEGLDKTFDSINDTINAAHDISTTGSKEQPSVLSYVDDIDTNDLEEMDLKWQVAMITMRVKKFMKRTGRNLKFNGKEPVGNRSADNERRVILVETPASALVVKDGLCGYKWSYQAKEGPTDFALIAHSSDSTNSSNSE
nr:ribonuclease H-like domain-containing protein [Tanacetum cinerariifolium]